MSLPDRVNCSMTVAKILEFAREREIMVPAKFRTPKAVLCSYINDLLGYGGKPIVYPLPPASQQYPGGFRQIKREERKKYPAALSCNTWSKQDLLEFAHVTGIYVPAKYITPNSVLCQFINSELGYGAPPVVANRASPVRPTSERKTGSVPRVSRPPLPTSRPPPLPRARASPPRAQVPERRVPPPLPRSRPPPLPRTQVSPRTQASPRTQGSEDLKKTLVMFQELLNET